MYCSPQVFTVGEVDYLVYCGPQVFTVGDDVPTGRVTTQLGKLVPGHTQMDQ